MYNPVSRFVEDIPAELLDEKIKEKQKPASDYSWGSYSSSAPKTYLGGSQSANIRPVAKPGVRPAPYGVPVKTVTVQKTSAAKKPAVLFAPGDRVKHPTFGDGEVISAKQMGSDILYEIIFDNVGTKKLMATYAKLAKV
jgi:DNA helicase-2/ATP-dependent DNA helicase PcrA